MAIVVEDGTIVPGANSYVSEAYLSTYATSRGITITGDTEELLIRAMDYTESLSFIGTKYTRDQPLQWPRVDVIIDSYYVDVTTIPDELKKGLCEVALSIDSGNDPLSDIARLQDRVKVGEIEVEYSSSSATTTSRKISTHFAKITIGGVSGASMTVDRG